MKINLINKNKIIFSKGSKVLFTDPCYIFSHKISDEMDKAWGLMVTSENFENKGLGRAIMDRLRRASN